MPPRWWFCLHVDQEALESALNSKEPPNDDTKRDGFVNLINERLSDWAAHNRSFSDRPGNVHPVDEDLWRRENVKRLDPETFPRRNRRKLRLLRIYNRRDKSNYSENRAVHNLYIPGKSQPCTHMKQVHVKETDTFCKNMGVARRCSVPYCLGCPTSSCWGSRTCSTGEYALANCFT